MKKQYLNYILPAIITILIIVLVLMLKGIYPFGNQPIDYYDNMQQVSPIYTHLWDFLHGQASLFLDWYTGLSTNFSMTISAFSLLSPFNLLLYLIPRENIHQYMYLFIIIKLAFMSETMYLYLNKKFSHLSYIFKLLFSLMFSFSGYQMLYSSSFMPWMDVIVFFPLLMLALDNIYQNKSNICYILCLTFCFIINYYITALILLFILIVTGLYTLFFVEEVERKKVIFKIAIATLISIGLAAFILVPTAIQLVNSQRLHEGNISLTEQFTTILNSVPHQGNWRLEQYIIYASSSLPVAIILWGVIQFRKEKKVTKMVIILLLLMILPMLIEGINLLLHFGSYSAYNMRYGFIITFVLLVIASYYASKIHLQEEKISFKKGIVAITLMVIIAISIIHFYPLLEKNLATYYDYNRSLSYYAGFFILQFILFATIDYLLIKENKRNLLFIISLLHIFTFAYICFGRPGWFLYDTYQDGNYIEIANEAKKELNLQEKEKINRIKNPDLSLNANYPFILEQPALSNYTANIPVRLKSSLGKLGYGCGFHTYLLDSGGTLFSDAILNIKQIINSRKLDENLYHLVKEGGGYFLYQSKYTLPFGMTTSEDILDIHFDQMDWIQTNNLLYQKLGNTKTKLIEPIIENNKKNSWLIKTEQHEKRCILQVMTEEPSVLYFSAGCDLRIKVNGKQITIPSIGEPDLTSYPNLFNSNIIALGTFGKEKVKIELELNDSKKLTEMQLSLGALKLSKMQEICDKYKDYLVHEQVNHSSITFTVTGTETQKVVLLPIKYDDSWNVTINGKKTDRTANVLDVFTAIEINQGNNEIEMKFMPKGLKLGIGISILSFLVFLIYIFKGEWMMQYFAYLTEIIFDIIWLLAITCIYVIPTIYFIWIKMITIA